ncbi:methyl-accepting chemotaxis sensory transducer with Pas/Pac sensor [Azospirillum oryzae]|uniref:Methyl-accepting chemotaxis sensory transducer with Pas/Pac sensor n=1 Tax=Azospirillum oryzae TaxID=286727 RepID=A0A1X7H445_9PROT|nr:PAS domain-containing methyl-accepting chemotaxis protein [Azospirillum oryzae]SMF79289.1 methyl-accepting chemotaxis sensory transducer with Pas/Pac sensor [Azospirillum oryzae]
MFGRGKINQVLGRKMAALDSLRAKVMVADENLTIVHVNPAVVTLLREAESDLRKDLPRLDVNRLVGSNIDVFHKNPSHQRGLLASLSKPYSATIKVGGHQFDLLVTPLTEDGRRIGFVVEWADAKERLENLDYAGQMAAISRSQAVIEFTTEGIITKANDNFLKVMGYRLDEVVGKHHNIFVEPAYRDSADYARFWETLRRGEFQAAQYKRIGKSGNPVWIEGAYNPILDEKGRVVKVVKFAVDVTAQVQLLNNLKVMIDKNFGEIDQALHLSMGEAHSANDAAGSTSASVQAVAASAEELVASIGEISQSMTRARSATDGAFDRTVAVAESTDRLAAAAQAMNGIVGLINSIAGQINLLALNATIEAARAGEAGKGFAVVASEVKNLANQAGKATEQISAEIEGIQSTSTEVANALNAIREAVSVVREHVTGTASAVEEQSAVTQNMSSNMQNASAAVATVTSNIAAISTAVNQVAGAVGRTKEAAHVLVR